MLRLLLAIATSVAVTVPLVFAAELYPITADRTPNIDGKEVDWIIGDYVLRSDKIIAVVANPLEGRDANMTVREVGACLIDLTRIDDQNDQLSAIYPLARSFQFHDAGQVTTSTGDGEVIWSCRSSGTTGGERAFATVEYRLRDGDDFIEVRRSIDGPGGNTILTADSVRADRTFDFDTIRFQNRPMAVFHDSFFRQAYAIVPESALNGPLHWDDQRAKALTYPLADEGQTSSRIEWTTRIYPASSLVGLMGTIAGNASQSFSVTGMFGDQPRGKLTIVRSSNNQLEDLRVPGQTVVRLNDSGHATVPMAPGSYEIIASSIGCQDRTATIEVDGEPGTHTIELDGATGVEFVVTDEAGSAIPAKLTFIGVDSTTSPDFGPDSADGSVKNCVYAVEGRGARSLPPGTYECVISHGPEYDAEVRRLRLRHGKQESLEVVLNRVVDTSGWVSAELHSHSSPSGDNTSSQRGRVQNLVCEHIEFAPCTEHQRIESYDDHLDALGVGDLMATCSGMELTGGPLPINHQNVFPLVWKPNTQNGGGPVTDLNPVVQIRRIALWDDDADKVVQINHPNLHQMARDKDLDGNDDGGFASMFEYADVIEVHPPQDIFVDPESLSVKDLQENTMLQWVRLLREGHRMPGVVNTDAHYNHHGSGWLRNWVRASTDDPAKIEIAEMTEQLEAGRSIMSTGPFMTVRLDAEGLEHPGQIGDTVSLPGGKGELVVKVQCPNWLDVNRVEVFVDGVPVPELARRRRTHPEVFADGVVKFDARLPLTIEKDAFIIVAAIGEGRVLGRVMGEQFGQQPPVVVSNPIYVERRE